MTQLFPMTRNPCPDPSICSSNLPATNRVWPSITAFSFAGCAAAAGGRHRLAHPDSGTPIRDGNGAPCVVEQIQAMQAACLCLPGPAYPPGHGATLTSGWAGHYPHQR